jgi:hypothetical protein
MTTGVLKSVLFVVFLAAGAARAENTIHVVNESGRPVAQFRIGDSSCVLKDDQIFCTPLSR